MAPKLYTRSLEVEIVEPDNKLTRELTEGLLAYFSEIGRMMYSSKSEYPRDVLNVHIYVETSYCFFVPDCFVRLYGKVYDADERKKERYCHSTTPNEVSIELSSYGETVFDKIIPEIHARTTIDDYIPRSAKWEVGER